MPGSLGQLTIDLAANITRFESALNRAEQLTQNRTRAMQRAFTRFASGVGASLAAFGFTAATREALNFADSIGKTADKLGISTSALQEFRFAAEQTGVPINNLDTAIQRFSRRIGEAAEGEGVLKDVIKDLNINLREQDGRLRSTESILGDYAEAIKNADSDQERLRLSVKAFDQEGAALVNTLRNGRDGLNAYRTEARDLGIVLDDQVIRNSEKANDALNRLEKILKVGMTDALISIAPAIERFTGYLVALRTGRAAELPDWLYNLASNWAVLGTTIDKSTTYLGAFFAVLNTPIGEAATLVPQIWKETQDRINQANIELDKYLTRLDTAQQPSGGLGPITITGGTVDPKYAAMNAELEAYFEKETELLLKSASVQEQIANQKIALEQAVTSARINAVNNAVQLMQLFAGKSKAAAIAAIALSKGVAIAQTIMSTQTAAMQARTAMIVPGDPSSVARAEAAARAIEAAGRVSVGLIAATGIGQIAALNTSASSGGAGSAAGGAAPGTPANPIYTDSTTALQSSSGMRGTITINVNGVVTDEILQDLIIPAIQEATNDKDMILFRNDSRQALELA